ncbi:creatininase family protein [Streptomyces sp. NBC_00885]|uniref:hypothetical protein n=1 Tax=Streptomyces sp. NBC_00885 TaxID=2975857 RepID=UPI00386DCB39|nr:creatininase family protein [Streptomyces sp. NBC_00885]
MNITELLTDLQARHDEATAKAGELLGQIEHFTAASPRPNHISRTSSRGPGHHRKVIAELARRDGRPVHRAASDANETVHVPRSFHRVRLSGVAGDARSATAEKGRSHSARVPKPSPNG